MPPEAERRHSFRLPIDLHGLRAWIDPIRVSESIGGTRSLLRNCSPKRSASSRTMRPNIGQRVPPKQLLRGQWHALRTPTEVVLEDLIHSSMPKDNALVIVSRPAIISSLAKHIGFSKVGLRPPISDPIRMLVGSSTGRCILSRTSCTKLLVGPIGHFKAVGRVGEKLLDTASELPELFPDTPATGRTM